jgi:hypothetical protein
VVWGPSEGRIRQAQVETKIIHKFPIIINFVMWQLEIMELKKKKKSISLV